MDKIYSIKRDFLIIHTLKYSLGLILGSFCRILSLQVQTKVLKDKRQVKTSAVKLDIRAAFFR